MSISFLKKYSPNKLEDFLLKPDIIFFLHKLIESDNMNIIIHGSCGIGKTTLINKCIEIYYNGIDNIENNIMNINCLKEQGIQFYRNDVKIFCQTKANILKKKKILILDDFDNVNEQSQQIFRNYLDKYNNNVMFICSCNNLNKINDNFLSRIFVIKFNILNNDYLLKIFNKIVKQEQLQIEKSVENKFILLANNSIRNLINNLEKIKLYAGKITSKNIYLVCSNINYDLFDQYTECILNNEMSNSVNKIYEVYNSGYSIIDIFYFYFIYIKLSDKVDENNKFKIIKILCKYIALINNNYEDDIELVLFSKNLIQTVRS